MTGYSHVDWHELGGDIDPATAITEFISGSSVASSTGPSHPLAEDLEPREMVIPEMGRGKRKKTQTKRYIERI
jgi:hypothetical protein